MSVAFGESVERHTAHEEIPQYAIHHVIHTARLHALTVIHIMSVHVGSGIFCESWVAIHLESLGQHLLAHHVLECLATLLQTMTFEAMTEYLMEEHSTCGP